MAVSINFKLSDKPKIILDDLPKNTSEPAPTLPGSSLVDIVVVLVVVSTSSPALLTEYDWFKPKPTEFTISVSVITAIPKPAAIPSLEPINTFASTPIS